MPYNPKRAECPDPGLKGSLEGVQCVPALHHSKHPYKTVPNSFLNTHPVHQMTGILLL